MDNSNRVDKLIKLIGDINMKIALMCLFILILLNGIEIIIRYSMGKSMIWIQEISVLFMVWLIFTGTTKIVYDKKDIVINIVVDKFPAKIKICIEILTRFLVLLFFIYYAYFGYELIITQWKTRTLVAEIRQIYFTIPVIIMSVSCTMIYINEIYKNIKYLREGGGQ